MAQGPRYTKDSLPDIDYYLAEMKKSDMQKRAKDCYDRFIKGETEMSSEDMFWATLHYVHSPLYSSMSSGNLLSKTLFKDSSYQELAKLLPDLIKKEPFSLPLRFRAVMTYAQLGDTIRLQQQRLAYWQLVSGYSFFGTGQSMQRPFIVPNVDDEYSIIYIVKDMKDYKSQSLKTNGHNVYDVMLCVDENDNEVVLYFDIDFLFRIAYKSMGGDSKSKSKSKK